MDVVSLSLLLISDYRFYFMVNFSRFVHRLMLIIATNIIRYLVIIISYSMNKLYESLHPIEVCFKMKKLISLPEQCKKYKTKLQ